VDCATALIVIMRAAAAVFLRFIEPPPLPNP
jgi:hypothetical protein